MTTPAPTAAPILWRPNPGPQERFVCSTSHELLFGGSAGGGKSSGLVALPLRWVGNPHFRALVLRRETTQLGDLLDKADALYTKLRLRARSKSTGAGRTYEFPSGSTIRFDHCQHEKDAARFDGFEFQVVEFDELTHFTLKQYRAVRARIRSPHPGLPRYTRSTTNPGGEGHEWVLHRWGPWLNPEHEAEGLVRRFDAEGKPIPAAAPGEVLWYIPGDAGDRWVPKGTEKALSRTFIPALASDNPHLLDNDPEYLQRLGDLDRVRREQLLRGNWLIRDAPGELFRAGWFQIVDAAPAECMRLRYWDRAATEPSSENPDPDWTVGVRLAVDRQGLYYVEDVKRARYRPEGVMRLVVATAQQDGPDVVIGIEKDPGQAGKFEAASYVTALAGMKAKIFDISGDKVTRAGPVSAQAEAGNIRLVRGAWNKPFLATLEGFPSAAHDDDVDGLSGAFNQLTRAALNAHFIRRPMPSPDVK